MADSNSGIWLTLLAAAFPLHNSVAADAVALEEVVVTAQKRSEKLQDIPVSAQVIGSEALARQNQSSLETLALTVPGVHIGPSGPSSEMYIRGIGSGQNQSFDQSVGTFVDDIYHGRSRTSTATFLDLERIEFLKGPQSTFFGNNAIAGAMNIVTRKPTDKFEANVRGLYGQDGRYAAEAAVGGPIANALSVRVAVIATGMDGWMKNVTTREHAPKENNYAGRLSLSFKPNDAFDALLKLETSKNRRRGTGYATPFQIVNCPPPAPIVPQFAGPGCAEALAAGDPLGTNSNINAGNAGQGSRYKSNEAVLTVNYNISGSTLTSVTGYNDYDFSMQHDNDGTSLLLMTRNAPEKYHQFSQEFRLASPSDQKVEYMVGAYYQKDRLSSRLDTNYFFATPFLPFVYPSVVPYGPLGQEFDFHQSEELYSVFGSAGWNVTDQLKVTAGLRGSWVKKDYTLHLFYGTATADYGGIVPLPANIQDPAGYFGQGVPSLSSGHRSDNAWMPSLKVQYKFNPTMMAYASFSRGFKAGGFNGTESSGDPTTIPFEPEYVNAYEIGLKSEWLDRSVLTNIAVFRSDYRDLQVAFWEFPPGGQGAAVPHIRNAAKSKSQGVELEARWKANERFEIAANLTYLDARYTDYKSAAGTVLQQFSGQATQDLSGARTQFSPDYSGSVTTTFNTPIGDRYRLVAELSPYFSTGYHIIFLIDKDFFWQKSYVRLDGRLGFEASDGRWSLDLIGKNLTDKTILTAFGGPYMASKEEPRNFALQFRARW